LRKVDCSVETEYGLRVWIRPDRFDKLGWTPSDVISASRNEHSGAAGGKDRRGHLTYGSGFQPDLKHPSASSRGRVREENVHYTPDTTLGRWSGSRTSGGGGALVRRITTRSVAPKGTGRAMAVYLLPAQSS
jgi:multidrug efflux pump subunit AcrB